MAEISFRAVTKVYGDGTEAVTSLSLDIGDGEFVVLVGPSGCGKSTLLRMLAGLEAITAGGILVDGEVVNQVHPRDRDVAMVFQNYALYPHMTVFANIAFPLRQARVPSAEITKRVTEVAETLELSEHLKRRPAALSGGQRQRVAIGRAIVRQPKAFLLDEPLSNLDAKLRVQMRGELAQLHATLGVTTVFVTHDQTEAMTLGERVAVLNDGELRQVGTPQELYHRPADLFVAGFIGSPSMNLLKAQVRSGEAPGGPALDFGAAGAVAVPEAAVELCASAPRGADLVAGIRPESLLLRDPEVSSKDLPRARVCFTELVEPETYVHLAGDFSGVDPGDPDAPPRDTLVARVRSDRAFRPGQEVALEIGGTGLHLFDIDSGRTIR
ncbi:MAG: sn-glycerol-3-phosphate ABC transporter ATP-binding protein UgpC [bacterium]|nr:sn-glycerol-3-phosphate ABC transporter ATP-binding protein UgpC [bacterium]